MKDLPQLIVALESLDDSANYIHISDANYETTYYCPCCKSIVKPRACKEDVDYQVQPHFYHENGGCSEESFVHYICKTWLFEKGSKFKIKNDTYTVNNIETEKTFHTQFGDYRPDIVVNTEENKTFFFEIKYSNKKTEHYIPKWDELETDVVEVDARELINQKHSNNVPEFKLIYSDGECFIKSYLRHDYEDTIARRKIEWKRQDKLNYKIQWERLDWFWNTLQEYANFKKSKEDTLNAFATLEYEDQIWCFVNVKGKVCVSLKEDFKEIINNQFFEELNIISKKNNDIIGFKINYEHTSPLVYMVHFSSNFLYLDYNLHEIVSHKIKLKNGLLLKTDFTEDLSALKKRMDIFKRLDDIDKISKLYYVKAITPVSHWASLNYTASSLFFKVVFHENIHNNYIKEEIGTITDNLYNINIYGVEDYFKSFKKNALLTFKSEQIECLLKNNSNYSDAISYLNSKCRSLNMEMSIKIAKNLRSVWLFYKTQEIDCFTFYNDDTFDNIGDRLIKRFSSKIDRYIKIHNIIERYINIINLCKNKHWRIDELTTCQKMRLYLFNDISYVVFDFSNVCDSDLDKYIKSKIFSSMKELADGLCGDVRVMEEK